MSRFLGNLLIVIAGLMASMSASIYMWGEEEMPECLAKRHEN